MKKFKLFFLAIFLLSLTGVQAQTYCFTAPQGYGAGTTGGGTGDVTVATNIAELKKALKAPGSGIVLVKGKIQCDYLSVRVTNKTLLGLPGATLYTNDQTPGKSGILYIKPGSDNIIIRNLTFIGPGAFDSDGRDCLTNEGTRVWVDHCEFQDGMDGNFDNKGTADNVTVSWCKFTYLKPPKAGGSGGTDDHRYSNLIGSSDKAYPTDSSYNVTWQYCWWADGCVERMVRARNSTIHQLNCYWNSQNTRTAIGLSAGKEGASDYIESSVFNCTGEISSVEYGGNPTIKFVNCTNAGRDVGLVNYPPYAYEVTPVDSVVSAVTHPDCGAGATLQVTENGIVSSTCPNQPTAITAARANTAPEMPNPLPASGITIMHNFTTSDTTSTFYTITGSLTSIEDPLTYSKLSLTQGLKMESTTSIAFIAAKAGELTLVLSADYNGRIKLDGIKSDNATSGILKIKISPGAHTITKSSSTNLYYLALTY